MDHRPIRTNGIPVGGGISSDIVDQPSLYSVGSYVVPVEDISVLVTDCIGSPIRVIHLGGYNH